MKIDRPWSLATFTGLALLLSGCGPTIGDACTQARDCGAGACVQQDHTPGGACSLACTVEGDDCPSGTTCVRDAIAHGQPGCLKSCTRQADCRDTYVCRVEQGSETPVCVGPSGI